MFSRLSFHLFILFSLLALHLRCFTPTSQSFGAEADRGLELNLKHAKLDDPNGCCEDILDHFPMPPYASICLHRPPLDSIDSIFLGVSFGFWRTFWIGVVSNGINDFQRANVRGSRSTEIWTPWKPGAWRRARHQTWGEVENSSGDFRSFPPPEVSNTRLARDKDQCLFLKWRFAFFSERVDFHICEHSWT